jgi:hypothetical protein
VIKNYSFGLSAFLFSISGVKIFQLSPLKTMPNSIGSGSEVVNMKSKYSTQILKYFRSRKVLMWIFPCVGSDGGGHDDRADHSGEQAGHQGTGGLGGEFDASARAYW